MDDSLRCPVCKDKNGACECQIYNYRDHIKQLEDAIENTIIKWEKEYRKWVGFYCVNTDYCEAILSDLKELQKALEGKDGLV